MGKWNEEAAPNNNLNSAELRSSKMPSQERDSHPFAEELSDDGERNKWAERQTKRS
ncbi:hypothetical protein ABE218_12940 [Bacillus smithii]|uniref:hypothetical protein n=1 Tax=Bacillus smithii TaxID=1479 RepID=UPI003D263ED4